MKQLTNKLEKRINEIDFLRGIAILLMIFDHAIYDLFGLMPNIFAGMYDSLIYDLAKAYWKWPIREVFHYIVVFVFLAITGICCSFSKSNIKRGIKLFIVSMLLSLLTLIAGLIAGDIDGFIIVFGVLHCISLTLIIIGLFEKIGLSKYYYLIIGLVSVLLGIIFAIDCRYVPLSSGNALLTILESIVGLVGTGTDHFPIFLNGGQIFIGVFLGRQFYSSKKSLLKNKTYKNNLVTFMGRNSLIVYFAHQIIVPIILGIILLIVGFKIKL